MADFLKLFEMHKDIKDIEDLVNEIRELRNLYYSKQFNEMNLHINNLTQKYFVETLMWNSINQIMPQTTEQQFINAEKFLKAQGVRILTEKGIKIIENLGDN